MMDTQDGWYSATFHPTVAGQYILSVTQMPWSQDVKGSPLTFQVLPSRYACASESSLSASPVGQAGKASSVPIVLKDCFGNVMSHQTYEAADMYSVAGHPTHLQISFQSPGTVSPSILFSSTLSGQFQVQVRLNRTALAGNPFTFSIRAGPANASTTVATTTSASVVAGVDTSASW